MISMGQGFVLLVVYGLLMLYLKKNRTVVFFSLPVI